MPDITFKFCGPALTIETIEAMESQLGCQLPSDYRQFLLQHNGGTPYPKSFDSRIEGDDSSSWIDCFHSVDESLAMACEDSGGSTIAFHHFEYGGGVPDDCLIIATSGRDDLLLLRLRGDRRGQVDLKIVVDWEPVQENKEEDVYPVAETFSALLAMLHE